MLVYETEDQHLVRKRPSRWCCWRLIVTLSGWIMFLAACAVLRPPRDITLGLQSTTLRIATWNVRYDPSTDSMANSSAIWGEERPWSVRRQHLADAVLYESPDIIGFQEVLPGQFDDLINLLGETYQHVGVGREDGIRRGEACPIFFKRTRFRQLGNAHYFWLSEDPENPGSIGWDAAQTRIVSVVHLSAQKHLHRHKGREHHAENIHILNTHFDDSGALSRTKAAELILERTTAMRTSGNLVLLLGDINSETREAPYQTLTDGRYDRRNNIRSRPAFLDSHQEVLLADNSGPSAPLFGPHVSRLHAIYGSQGTFSGFGRPSEEVNTVVDFIMLAHNAAARAWSVRQAAILPNLLSTDKPRLSDHRMVVTILQKQRESKSRLRYV